MSRKKKMIAFAVAIAVGFGLAMAAMAVMIYFGYTDAYAIGVDTLHVSMFGLDIYTLTKAGEQYNGASVGQNMGIICAGFTAVAVLVEQIIVRAVGKKN